jgi:hypothetical protein
VYTLDADLVVVSASLGRLADRLRSEGFSIEEHEHSLNTQGAGSDLRIQFTTDVRYPRAGRRVRRRVRVHDFVLMKLPQPKPEVVAAAWFRKTAIRGVTFKRGSDGRRLIAAPGGGPIWARYYEIGSDRPIFGDRVQSIHDDVNEISLERRNGYSWHNAAPAAALERYAVWSAAHP